MQPTPNGPGGSFGNESNSDKNKSNSPYSQPGYTSGTSGTGYTSSTDTGYTGTTSGSSYGSYQAGKHSTDADLQSVLDSGWQNKNDKWRDANDIADTAKDLGNKALDGIKNLNTSQIAIGVGILAAGIAFLATRGKKHKHPKKFDHAGRRDQDSYFGHQPHTRMGNDLSHRGQRPWGSSRFGGENYGGGYGRGRVQSGSGYGYGYDTHGYDDRNYDNRNSYDNRGGRRRDQGPTGGNRYDVNTSGQQNPNNSDQLGGGF